MSEFRSLKTRCLQEGKLYEDPDFPAPQPLQDDLGSVEWIRPQEISKNAKFFSNGTSRFDVKQGQLSNCWFAAALTNLTLNEKVFRSAVPDDNCWENGDGYAGICHFRFWNSRSNSWEEVIIDDRLPTQNGKLIFIRSDDNDEFWGSLLEKAFAKFYGSYQKLEGGRISTGMVELTGGSAKQIELKRVQLDVKNLFDIMNSALNAGHLLGCAIYKGKAGCEDLDQTDGLVCGHAYSITAMKKVKVKVEEVDLLRIRNPWGNDTQWKGDWSDEHHLWALVDEDTKAEIKLINEEDGEFWFPFNEFAKYFDLLEICYLPANNHFLTIKTQGIGEDRRVFWVSKHLEIFLIHVTLVVSITLKCKPKIVSTYPHIPLNKEPA